MSWGQRMGVSVSMFPYGDDGSNCSHPVETGTHPQDAVVQPLGMDEWRWSLLRFGITLRTPHLSTIVHEVPKSDWWRITSSNLGKRRTLELHVITCVGGGSQCYRCFLYCSDSQDLGSKLPVTDLTQTSAATMTKVVSGVDGMKTYAVFKEDGELLAPEVYSISAGLDIRGVGPERLL